MIIDLQEGDIIYSATLKAFQEINKEANEKGLQALIFDIKYDDGEKRISFRLIRS